MQVTHDGWGPNIGLMYLRPTPSTQAFVQTWLARRTAADSRDQYEFEKAVNQSSAEGSGLSVHVLSNAPFPNGCCCGHFLPKDRERARGWLMWHAACSGSMATKLGLLDKLGSEAAKLRTA